MMSHEKRTWAEVNLSALEKNYRYLRGLAPKSKFLALCKADGYGHGGLLVARKLEQWGAEMVAVACVEEAVALRKGGLKCPILCLGITPIHQYGTLLQWNITQTLDEIAQGEILSQLAIEQGEIAPVHLKLDTGMGRLGILSQENAPTTQEIQQFLSLPGLQVEGVYTHFARSDEPEGKTFTQQQLGRFLRIKQELESENIQIPCYHTANSGATLFHPSTHFDMIRPGIALYGYPPDGSENPQLTPVLTLKSRISSLKKLPKGWTIGYGSTHVLQRDSLVGVLPVGYGDGYPRHGSGKKVLVLGEMCPVLGRICMDMTLIDLTHLEGRVTLEDTAILYGQGNLLQHTATQGETIPYELLCNLSNRVERVAVEGNE